MGGGDRPAQAAINSDRRRRFQAREAAVARRRQMRDIAVSVPASSSKQQGLLEAQPNVRWPILCARPPGSCSERIKVTGPAIVMAAP